MKTTQPPTLESLPAPPPPGQAVMIPITLAKAWERLHGVAALGVAPTEPGEPLTIVYHMTNNPPPTPTTSAQPAPQVDRPMINPGSLAAQLARLEQQARAAGRAQRTLSRGLIVLAQLKEDRWHLGIGRSGETKPSQAEWSVIRANWPGAAPPRAPTEKTTANVNWLVGHWPAEPPSA